MKKTEKAPTNEEKEDPRNLYCGHKTKEELEARRKQFSEDLKKGLADWLRDHPNGELPEVD